MLVMDKEEKDMLNEYIQNNTKEDFLALVDKMVQDNPFLMKLAFSVWKLREMNILDDLQMKRIQNGLEENREQLKEEYIRSKQEKEDEEEERHMNRLVQIFETYKSSEYYNNSTVEINLDWLKDKLSLDDLEELEKQIYGIVLENEEEVFINCFRYAFELFQEIAVKKD